MKYAIIPDTRTTPTTLLRFRIAQVRRQRIVSANIKIKTLELMYLPILEIPTIQRRPDHVTRHCRDVNRESCINHEWHTDNSNIPNQKKENLRSICHDQICLINDSVRVKPWQFSAIMMSTTEGCLADNREESPVLQVFDERRVYGIVLGRFAGAMVCVLSNSGGERQ